MKYPKIPDYKHLLNGINDFAVLKAEYGADVQTFLDGLYVKIEKELDILKNLKNDETLQNREPDDLTAIRKLSKGTNKRLWTTLDEDVYREKLMGAMLGRFAGCILGAPIEFVNLEHVEKYLKSIGDAFPPVDYISQSEHTYSSRYMYSKYYDYTRYGMNGVPCDDDITYTILGLLIAEDCGLNFDVHDIGKSWLKYLPMACTAEDVALQNLKKGISADKAGDIDNPYVQWIGADIRSDPWGYIAPAYPYKAAEMAYHDAYISHRRNGIYGEMFFSAAISAAFAVDNAVDAYKIALDYIPENCKMAEEMRWALDISKNIKDYKDAKIAVAERYSGMSGVHTINNACFTLWGTIIGENDVTKVLSQTVAMGLDNDCTTATAGSIVGAIVGKQGIPEYWYKNFNNKVITYINDNREVKIDDLENRFFKMASKCYNSK